MIQAVNLTRRAVLARRVALGATFWLRLRGLMFRRRFGPFDGLWLYPTAEIHMFWVRFPIDLVWLDGEFQVVRATSSIQPWRVERCAGARSVIELPAGVIEQTGTQLGDRIAFGGFDDPTLSALGWAAP